MAITEWGNFRPLSALSVDGPLSAPPLSAFTADPFGVRPRSSFTCNFFRSELEICCYRPNICFWPPRPARSSQLAS